MKLTIVVSNKMEDWETQDFKIDLTPSLVEKEQSESEEENEIVEEEIILPKKIVVQPEPEFVVEKKGLTVYTTAEKSGKRIACAYFLLDNTKKIIAQGGKLLREHENFILYTIENIRRYTKENITFYTNIPFDVELHTFKIMVSHFESFKIVMINRKLNKKTINFATTFIEADKASSRNRFKKSQADKRNQFNYNRRRK